MRAQAGAGLDPKAYKEAMRALEEEMMNLKNMYERELARLRQAVDDANREKSCLLANLNACSTKSTTLQSRFVNKIRYLFKNSTPKCMAKIY